MRRKRRDDAGNRLCGVERMQSGKHQVACFRGGQGRFDRFKVAHLTDQDHIRVLAQRHAQRFPRTNGCRRQLRAA